MQQEERAPNPEDDRELLDAETKKSYQDALQWERAATKRVAKAGRGGPGHKRFGAKCFWFRCMPADGSCEQNTLTRHIFSCLHACLTVSHVTLAQGVVRVIPSMFHALVCLTSLRLSTLHSSQSLPSSTSSSCSSTSSPMWVGSERDSLCASGNEESGSLVNNAPLTEARKRTRRVPST